MNQFFDPQKIWPGLSGTNADGAVLVRPDGHVLWRLKSIADALPYQQHSMSDPRHSQHSPTAGTAQTAYAQHITTLLRMAMLKSLGKH